MDKNTSLQWEIDQALRDLADGELTTEESQYMLWEYAHNIRIPWLLVKVCNEATEGAASICIALK